MHTLEQPTQEWQHRRSEHLLLLRHGVEHIVVGERLLSADNNLKTIKCCKKSQTGRAPMYIQPVLIGLFVTRSVIMMDDDDYYFFHGQWNLQCVPVCHEGGQT